MAENNLGNTQYFRTKPDQELQVKEVLDLVYNAMDEKGYNPVNQIVGYIMSGDPTYITSHKGCLLYTSDTEAILKDVKAALEDLRSFVDIGEATITESQTEDKDWINNWKQYFHQFYVDDILIVPSWEEVKAEDKDKMILHIDPGTAFGTGMHETTQLVIRQLKKFVKPRCV